MGTRRTYQDRAAARASDQARLNRADVRQPQQRHCWVRQPDGSAIEGLVVIWHRTPAGWQADIVIIDDTEPRTITASARDVLPARQLNR